MSKKLQELDAAGVQAFLDAGDGPLVDVLTPEHFERRHIPGAVNACVFQVVFVDTMAGLAPDKTRPLALYGAGGESRDYQVAAEKLFRAGYADVSVFPGGIEAWAVAGRPLTGAAAAVLDPPHPVFSPEPRLYTLVPEKSGLFWTGRNHNVSHYGTLAFAKAEVDFTKGITGFMDIDMTSIRNLNLAGDPLQAVLEAHLSSDDFFFSRLFPTARFTIRGAELGREAAATSPNYWASGDLTIRGVTKAVDFPAHFRMLDDGQIGLHASLDFDRTDWGAIYGSAKFFSHLGMHAVYDMISIEARVVLR